MNVGFGRHGYQRYLWRQVAMSSVRTASLRLSPIMLCLVLQAFCARDAASQIVSPPGPQPTTCAGNVVTAYSSYGSTFTCGSPAASGVVNVGTTGKLGLYPGAGATVGPSTTLTDSGTLFTIGEPADIQTFTLSIERPNDGTTGTTQYTLTTLTAAGNAIKTSASAPTQFLGVTLSASATTGNAQIAIGGQPTITFDGATTSGDLVIPSITNDGQVHDSGAATCPTNTTTLPVVGKVLSTHGAGGNYAVQWGTFNCGGGGVGSATNGQLLTNSTGNIGGLTVGTEFTASGTLHIASAGVTGAMLASGAVATNLGFTPPTNARNIATTAPLSGGGDLTADRTLTLAGPSNLTTFTASAIPKGAGTSAFAASSITDAGGGVIIGSPTGGAQGAGTLNATGLYVGGASATTTSGMTTGTIPFASGAAAIGNSEVVDTAGNGVVVGSPTGGQQGAGTVNATGVFVNGVAVGTGSGNVSTSGGTTNRVPQWSSSTALSAGLPVATTGTSTILESDSGGNAKAPVNTTTGTFSGQIVSSLTTGTAPFVIASTTNVPNLNASLLNGSTFANPGPIGTTSRSSAQVTDFFASGIITASGLSAGTCAAGIALDGSNNVVRTNCPSGGGLSGMVASQIPIASGAATIASSLPTSGTAGGVQIVSSNAGTKTLNHLGSWDINGNLIDNGVAIGGMASGQVPIASAAGAISSSVPLSGTSGATQVASATSAAKTSGDWATWDANGNLVDGGAVSRLSGMTGGQVPIAATGATVTSSLPISSGGSATQIVGSTTAAKGTNNIAIWDANDNLIDGGAWPLSGLTIGQVPIAGSASTVTSSVPVGNTGNSTILRTDASGNEKAPVNTTTGAFSQPVTSTVSQGTAPFVVGSTTMVANLNANYLGGATFAAPAPIGSTTPNSATFTNLSTSGTITHSNLTSGACASGLALNGSSQVVTVSCPAGSGLSGMSIGQVPIAAGATSVASSLPLSGSTGAAQVVSATSATKTSGHLTTWDANGNLIDGGAVPSGGLSGMTASQVPIAASASTVTSSRALGTTGNSTILQTDGTGNMLAPVNTTTGTFSGALTSTRSTGSGPPFVVASTANVANLNASSLNGATFAAPGAIGGTTPGAGSFSTLAATGAVTASGLSAGTCNNGVVLDSGNHLVTTTCPSGNIVGMTAGQVPLAASSSTITSSLALSGSGGIVASTNSTGKTSGNVAVWDSQGNIVDGGGTAGTGTVTSVALSPGFTTTPGTQNTGSQTITASGTLYSQMWPVAVSASCTLDLGGGSGCQSTAGIDSGAFIIPSAAGLTITAPASSATGTRGRTYNIGSDGTDSYTVAIAGGSQTIGGCTGGGANTLVVPPNVDVVLIDMGSTTGTSYKCSFFDSRPQQIPFTYLPGQNLAAATHGVGIARAPTGIAMVVTAIVCNPEIAVGASGDTIDFYYAASGTVPDAGTKINSVSFNADGTANTDQSLSLSSPNITAGGRIAMKASGSNWATSAGAGSCIVYLR